MAQQADRLQPFVVERRGFHFFVADDLAAAYRGVRLAEGLLVRQPDVRLGVDAPVTRQRLGGNADSSLEVSSAGREIVEQEADGIRPGTLAERDQDVRPAGRLDARVVQVGDNL